MPMFDLRSAKPKLSTTSTIFHFRPILAVALVGLYTYGYLTWGLNSRTNVLCIYNRIAYKSKIVNANVKTLLTVIREIYSTTLV